MNRDSYLNFLKKFNISNEDFIEYGLNDIIFVPNDKVISEWDILKNKLQNAMPQAQDRPSPIRAQQDTEKRCQIPRRKGARQRPEI